MEVIYNDRFVTGIKMMVDDQERTFGKETSESLKTVFTFDKEKPLVGIHGW